MCFAYFCVRRTILTLIVPFQANWCHSASRAVLGKNFGSKNNRCEKRLLSRSVCYSWWLRLRTSYLVLCRWVWIYLTRKTFFLLVSTIVAFALIAVSEFNHNQVGETTNTKIAKNRKHFEICSGMTFKLKMTLSCWTFAMRDLTDCCRITQSSRHSVEAWRTIKK